MKTTPTRPKAKRFQTAPKPRKLNQRQERFCEFVVAGESQTEAYLKAGFKVPRGDARKHAARLMTNDGVKARIDELRAPQTRKALLSKDRKREWLRDIIENPGEKTQDRLRALELDAKLAGHFEPDRVEVEAGPKTLLSIKERAAEVSSALARRYTTSQPE